MIHPVANLMLGLDEPETRLPAAAARRLGVCVEDIAALVVRRRSLDARKGRSLTFVYTVDVTLRGEPADAPAAPSVTPPVARARVAALPPPVVVGAGPAGLFAALALAARGVPPVLLERGRPVLERHHDVGDFRRRGALHPESNVCFGEGGAGTYSDGKLFTRKRGPDVEAVLAVFVRHGADPAIEVDAHPHIGSNRLGPVITRMRETLLAAGATVRFGARVAGLEVRDGRVVGVRLADGEVVPASAVVLAAGHAARDVYAMLHASGVGLAPKGFAVGFRIEHPQPVIDAVQYGSAAGHPRLPPAEYRIARQVGLRGVYSFCMCPGGYVIATPVEEGGVVVNGMSNHRRGSPFANSALVVELAAAELPALAAAAGVADPTGPLVGMAFQRALEQAAFVRGGGGFHVPATRVTDFLAGRATTDLPSGRSCRPGLAPTSLRGLLPPSLEEALVVALRGFGRGMPGFVSDEALLFAVESMTSAPVTVLRDAERFESPTHPGLYPAGEGAGHAGGITSSAADGLRVAAAILRDVYGS